MIFHDFSIIFMIFRWFLVHCNGDTSIFGRSFFRKSASRGFEPTRDFGCPFPGLRQWWLPLRHNRGCGLRVATSRTCATACRMTRCPKAVVKGEMEFPFHLSQRVLGYVEQISKARFPPSIPVSLPSVFWVRFLREASGSSTLRTT